MSIDSPPPAKRSSKGQRAYIGAAIVVFALISVYLGLVIVTRVDSIFLPANRQISLPGPISLPGVQSPDDAPKDRINILVMGLDRRPREGDTPTRTDTLFVVTVDPKTNSTGILGFPRDLYVDIPGKSGGTFTDRINTVYVNGELSKYDGGGVGLMKQVMQDDFGIHIDKYVIIDFKGFESVIDDLGGIDIDVPDEIYDPNYSETELPGDFLPQHFYPGMQHMDGQTALAYSRIRFNSDDLDRIQRQQRVIFAAIDKAKSLNVLKNAVSLWGKYKDAIHTDISDLLLPKYALLAHDVQDNIHAVSLGPATYPYTDPRTGAEVLLGDQDKIKAIVKSIFEDPPGSSTPIPDSATPEPVTVQIQNGAGVDQLATNVVKFIIGHGYLQSDLSATNVFDGQPHATSEILDLDGTHQRNAYLLANWLGISTDHVRTATAAEKSAIAESGAAEPAIVIILGSDKNYSQLIESPTTSVPAGG